MSAEEPETEAGAANDATEVVDDDFSSRLRNVAGSQADTQEAWSDEDDAADDAESESQPWSVVTGHAAALLSVGAAVAAVIAVLGWIMLHKDRPAPSPAAGKNTSPAAAPAPPPPPTVTVQETPPSAVRCGPAGCTPSPVAPTTAAAPNGVYRFDYPASGSGLDAIGPSSIWWKFSSECARDGCTALGQEVIGTDHRTLVAGEVEIYTFSGGMWHLQASPPNPNDDAPNIPDPVAGCGGGGQTLAPQPDGGFLGINTAIVPPCGSANTKVETFQAVKVSS
jgi:hypothetical protein